MWPGPGNGWDVASPGPHRQWSNEWRTCLCFAVCQEGSQQSDSGLLSYGMCSEIRSVKISCHRKRGLGGCSRRQIKSQHKWPRDSGSRHSWHSPLVALWETSLMWDWNWSCVWWHWFIHPQVTATVTAASWPYREWKFGDGFIIVYFCIELRTVHVYIYIKLSKASKEFQWFQLCRQAISWITTDFRFQTCVLRA